MKLRNNTKSMAYLAALNSWSMDWAWSEIVNFMAVTTMVLIIS